VYSGANFCKSPFRMGGFCVISRSYERLAQENAEWSVGGMQTFYLNEYSIYFLIASSSTDSALSQKYPLAQR